MSDIIEINGKRYQAKPEAPVSGRKFSKYIATALAMGASMTYLDQPFKPRQRYNLTRI